MPDLDQETVDVSKTYKMAGILSFGRGLFERAEMAGSETSYAKLTRLHTDQFVYSRLFAWEGALAVVPEPFDGYYVSHEFPTFRIDRSAALPAYLDLIARWSGFHELVAKGAKGLGVRRKRVHPEQLLAIDIPLPDLAEQRRLAEALNTINARINYVEERVKRVDASFIARLYPALVEKLLQTRSERRARVGELVEIVSDVVHPGDDPGPAKSFVGLQHIERNTGRRTGELPVGGEKGRKFRFRPGDILYGYLRPYLNKVWVADRHGLCSVDQYVLRPNTGVSAGFLAHALRSQAFLRTAIDLTHNLQLPRLRSGLLLDVTIPLPRPDSVEAVESELDFALDHVLQLAALRSQQSTKVKALIPSILNQALNGGR